MLICYTGNGAISSDDIVVCLCVFEIILIESATVRLFIGRQTYCGSESLGVAAFRLVVGHFLAGACSRGSAGVIISLP